MRVNSYYQLLGVKLQSMSSIMGIFAAAAAEEDQNGQIKLVKNSEF